MEITFLGTAAAEGFPAVFCNCKYCQEARVLKGKNIRTRSQSIINDDLLIDLPADTYVHFLQNGIRGDKLKYLLITHSHMDHFYPSELEMRVPPFAHDFSPEELILVCGEGAYKKLNDIPDNIKPVLMKPFESITLGEYKITALPARHMKGDGALFYIIEGDKTILYAHDTGYFFEEVFDFIKEKGFVFDFITFDCTFIDIPASDTESHMGFPNINRVIERLQSLGAITESTKKYVNHFSHNGNPLHEHLEKRAAEFDCNVSFDGLTVKI